MAVYDVAIVGAGIIGLAHAYIAASRGKKVVVIDRDAQANGASVRNFGFVTITGQPAGDCWDKARRTRDLWQDVAKRTGIDIVQQGMVLAARHGPAETLIDAFLKTDMGAQCLKLTNRQAQERIPPLNAQATDFALYSPHEIRLESRTAISQLTTFLNEQLGVVFHWNTLVHDIDEETIKTSHGILEAEAVIVCPGDDFKGLYSGNLAQYGLKKCKLQMLRIKPKQMIPMQSTVLSELSLARSGGYANLPGLSELQTQLDQEMPGQRSNDIHLIVAQSGDGSFVVGDSHHHATTPDPFGLEAVDDLMLAELDRVLTLPERKVTARWVGTYATAPGRWRLTDKPAENVRVVIVTSGSGASTCFAIAEETIDGL